MSAAQIRSIAGEQTIETPPRFTLVPFSEIRLGTARAYVVKGLIPRAGLIVVWGPPKCGKSFWAFDIAMHIALGREYRDRRVLRGAVVYGAFEGADGFTKRIEAFRMKRLAEETDPIPFYLLAARMDLIADHADLIACIRNQTSGEAPALVVLDTLNRSLNGSESKDEDMAAYVRAADAIREAFGCAVMIVHHCGIEGTRPRGHTSLTGAADAQLAVKRDTDGPSTVTVEWMKDGPEGDVIAFRLERVEVGLDEDGDQMDSCVVVPAEMGAAGKQSRRATGATKIALDLLIRAVAGEGQPAPANSNIPPNVNGVSVEVWRRFCYDGTIAKSDSPDAKRRAFNRAQVKLQELKLIGVWSDFVWAVL